MAILSNLVVRITGNTANLEKAMDKTLTRSEKFSRSASRSFRTFGDNVRNSARQVPIIGDALASLPGPAGIAAGAIGLVAVAIGGAIVKVIQLEKELRPAIERSRFAAEELQVLSRVAERLGSEDGLEGVVDTSQELQLQLGEIALAGKSRATPALEALGLSAAKLQAMRPQDAWLEVVDAIQQVPGVANRAILAEEIFGGTSEKLAGIVNATSSEFQALRAEVEALGGVLSQEDLDRARELDDNMAALGATWEKIQIFLATTFIPLINKFIEGWELTFKIIGEGLDRTRKGFNAVARVVPGLDPVPVHDLAQGVADLDTSAGAVARSAVVMDETIKASAVSMNELATQTTVATIATQELEKAHKSAVKGILDELAKLEAAHQRVDDIVADVNRQMQDSYRSLNNTINETVQEHYDRVRVEGEIRAAQLQTNREFLAQIEAAVAARLGEIEVIDTARQATTRLGVAFSFADHEVELLGHEVLTLADAFSDATGRAQETAVAIDKISEARDRLFGGDFQARRIAQSNRVLGSSTAEGAFRDFTPGETNPAFAAAMAAASNPGSFGPPGSSVQGPVNINVNGNVYANDFEQVVDDAVRNLRRRGDDI